jgi:hypothetical protein
MFLLLSFDSIDCFGARRQLVRAARQRLFPIRAVLAIRVMHGTSSSPPMSGLKCSVQPPWAIASA